jgi:hypothetical protein
MFGSLVILALSFRENQGEKAKQNCFLFLFLAWG